MNDNNIIGVLPFITLSPIPFAIRQMPSDITESPIGPMTFCDAVEIFWKLKSFNFSDNLSISYPEENGTFNASASFSFTPNLSSDCIANLPPAHRVKARASDTFADSYDYSYGDVNCAKISGPFYSESTATLDFYERDFYYTIYLSTGIDEISLSSTPPNASNCIHIFNFALFNHPFNMYVLRNNERNDRSYTYSASFSYEEYNIQP